MQDAGLLLEWANDPAVREASFNSEPITAERHEHWLESKLPEGGFYIAELDGTPIGYARVDRVAKHATFAFLSASVAEPYRGRGLGRELIAAAAKRASAELNFGLLFARIKCDNAASLRAFGAAGFFLPARRPDDSVTLEWHAP